MTPFVTEPSLMRQGLSCSRNVRCPAEPVPPPSGGSYAAPPLPPTNGVPSQDPVPPISPSLKRSSPPKRGCSPTLPSFCTCAWAKDFRNVPKRRGRQNTVNSRGSYAVNSRGSAPRRSTSRSSTPAPASMPPTKLVIFAAEFGEDTGNSSNQGRSTQSTSPAARTGTRLAEDTRFGVSRTGRIVRKRFTNGVPS